jgi:hypothetical protein
MVRVDAQLDQLIYHAFLRSTRKALAELLGGDLARSGILCLCYTPRHAVRSQAIRGTRLKADGMRYHSIAPEVPCPFCNRPGLTFMRKRPVGDLYTCTGCRHTVLHQRTKAHTGGGGLCGLRVVFGALEYGPWHPCCPPEKGE